VHCNTQEEIDYLLVELCRPEGRTVRVAEKTGSAFLAGVPTVMDEMLQDKNETKLARVTEAFLKMKKFDIAKLKEAYGKGVSRLARDHGTRYGSIHWNRHCFASRTAKD